MTPTDLSRSLCPCVLLCKHSCSSLSCHSCRCHGFHKVSVHMGHPLGGDKDKHLVQYGSCAFQKGFCELAHSVSETDL